MTPSRFERVALQWYTMVFKSPSGSRLSGVLDQVRRLVSKEQKHKST